MKKIMLMVVTMVTIVACNNAKKQAQVGELNKLSDDKNKSIDITTYKAEAPASDGLTAYGNFASTNGTADFAADSSASEAPEQEQINNATKPKNETTKPVFKTYQDWDKKIIKTANISLELKNYSNYNQTIRKAVKNFGGYIAQEEQTQSDDKLMNEMVIKVPVENFDELVNNLAGDSIKVIEKKITSQDVTSEVVDTKARIEAKKIVRAQYLELLKQAKNMKDILEVQTEVNTVQEDIESAGGRVSYLVHQSAYSTINLKYFQQLNGKTVVEDSNGFFVKLKTAFKSGGSIIVYILLLLINIWPILIIGFVSLFLWEKKKQNKQNLS